MIAGHLKPGFTTVSGMAYTLHPMVTELAKKNKIAGRYPSLVLQHPELTFTGKVDDLTTDDLGRTNCMNCGGTDIVEEANCPNCKSSVIEETLVFCKYWGDIACEICRDATLCVGSCTHNGCKFHGKPKYVSRNAPPIYPRDFDDEEEDL